jgi:predicted nucleic acid-binding Zn ribbon protein
MQSMSKCAKCHRNGQVRENYCSKCYEVLEMMKDRYKTFDLQIYDNLINIEQKRNYFNKYLYEFWRLFCQKTNLAQMSIITNYGILKNLITKTVNTASPSYVYLSLNGLYDISAIMAMSNILDTYIKEYILPYESKNKELVTNTIIAMGQSYIDPWNSQIDLIRNHMGNNGQIPKTSNDIFTIWYNNKNNVHKHLGTNIVWKCENLCGYELKLSQINITKSMSDNTQSHTSSCFKKQMFMSNNLNTKIDINNDDMIF